MLRFCIESLNLPAQHARSYVLIYLATGSLPWQGIRGGTSKVGYYILAA
jgi:hypothetical protein